LPALAHQEFLQNKRLADKVFSLAFLYLRCSDNSRRSALADVPGLLSGFASWLRRI
jgi:hypothetical protein